MIWYVGLFICAVISFFLAWRSMRDFQEAPEVKSTDYGLFLIRNSENLTEEVFSALLDSLKGLIASFERIKKGSSEALVGYLPHFIQSQFPSLGMVEIEDYILGRNETQNDSFILSRQLNLDDSFAWTLQSKKKQKPSLDRKSLDFDLQPDQYVAFQLVCEGGSTEKVQITPRVIVKDSHPQHKIELIKKVKKIIDQNTSLLSDSSLIHAGVFQDYKKRTLVPKQVRSFEVEKKALFDFLK